MIRDPNTEPIPAPDPATPTVAAPAPISLAAESMSGLAAEVERRAGRPTPGWRTGSGAGRRTGASEGRHTGSLEYLCRLRLLKARTARKQWRLNKEAMAAC
jgi:hypothetical protein